MPASVESSLKLLSESRAGPRRQAPDGRGPDGGKAPVVPILNWYGWGCCPLMHCVQKNQNTVVKALLKGDKGKAEQRVVPFSVTPRVGRAGEGHLWVLAPDSRATCSDQGERARERLQGLSRSWHHDSLERCRVGPARESLNDELDPAEGRQEMGSAGVKQRIPRRKGLNSRLSNRDSRQTGIESNLLDLSSDAYGMYC